eukprot:94369-Amphidinium_carterae.1
MPGAIGLERSSAFYLAKDFQLYKKQPIDMPEAAETNRLLACDVKGVCTAPSLQTLCQLYSMLTFVLYGTY